MSRAMFAAALAMVFSCVPTAQPPRDHHHELHLPPPTAQVSLALDGKRVDVVLANVPHDGGAVSLVGVWRSAFPADEVVTLHFELVGSDGFHPGSRPACARLLTGSEIAAARMDVATHDVSFDESVKLPGCYRVKGVVRIEASR